MSDCRIETGSATPVYSYPTVLDKLEMNKKSIHAHAEAKASSVIDPSSHTVSCSKVKRLTSS